MKNGVDNHLERDKDLIGAHVPFAKVFIEEKSDATDSDGSGSDSDDSDSDDSDSDSDDSDSDSNSDSDADSDSDDSDDSDTDFDDSGSDSDSDDEDSDMDDDDVPANGLRHRMSLACGTDVFFDSGDGEWGFVKEGVSKPCDEKLDSLIDANIADAKKIIYDELDWGNSYVADGRARGSDEESDNEQDETQDGDRRLPYPFQYRLFPNVNRHRDKKGIC